MALPPLEGMGGRGSRAGGIGYMRRCQIKHTKGLTDSTRFTELKRISAELAKFTYSVLGEVTSHALESSLSITRTYTLTSLTPHYTLTPQSLANVLATFTPSLQLVLTPDEASGLVVGQTYTFALQLFVSSEARDTALNAALDTLGLTLTKERSKSIEVIADELEKLVTILESK